MKFRVQEGRGIHTAHVIEPTAEFGSFLAQSAGLLDREVQVIRLNFIPEDLGTEIAMGALAVYDLFDLSDDGIFTLKDSATKMDADYLGDGGAMPGGIRAVKGFKEIIPVTPRFLEVYDL